MTPVPLLRHNPTFVILALMGFLLVSFSIASVSAFATATSVETWYPELAKPWFTPPNEAFSPVWALLFFFIAISGWQVWRLVGFGGAVRGFAFYVVQYGLNMLWSILFFGYQAVGLALIEIVFLLLAILATWIEFRAIDRWAGLLLVPYALWVVFAGVLNATIWWMN